MPTHDAIVVGAGPAGATVAYELAKSGLDVLILEKEKFPRYKPCGGGLSLKINQILNFSINDAIEATVMGAYFTCNKKEGLLLLSDRPVAYMVMRERFDSILISEALKAGAKLIEGSQVKGIAYAKKGYDVLVGNKVFNSQYVIGADGVNGVTRRFIHPHGSRYIAASLEAEIPLGQEMIDRHSNYVHIDFGAIPYGYAWVFPKKRYLSAGIAGFRGTVKQPKRYFDKFIKGHTTFSGIKEYKYKGYPIPLFRNSQHLTKGGILLTGDAGNLVDPFFGEGIYYAIRSAQIASSVVSKTINNGGTDLSQYDKLLGNELYPEFKAAQRMSQAVYAFPTMWYDILSERQELAEKYYDVLRGDSRYTLFLKELKSIAGSLMKTAVKKGILQFFQHD